MRTFIFNFDGTIIVVVAESRHQAYLEIECSYEGRLPADDYSVIEVETSASRIVFNSAFLPECEDAACYWCAPQHKGAPQ
jgi:hypothetical protein